MSGKYLIWSNEHRAWWRPNRCGYTSHMLAAGQYDNDEALRICAMGRDGWCLEGPPSEIPVRVEDAEACQELFAAAMRGMRERQSATA